MAGKIKNPAVVCALSLLCCALWGSAFPCIKLGYAWLDIEGDGEPDPVCGIPVLPVRSIYISDRVYRGEKAADHEEIIGMAHFQAGYPADHGAVCLLLYRTGVHDGGRKARLINASQGFVAIIAAHFMLKTEKMTWKKAAGCILGLAGVVAVNLAPGGMGSGFTLQGEGMILICTVVYGISMVLLKMISDEESPMTNHGMADPDGRRSSDCDRCADGRTCGRLHTEKRSSSYLYGTSFNGCVQCMDNINEIQSSWKSCSIYIHYSNLRSSTFMG